LQNQNRFIRAFGRKEIWDWPLFWFALPVYFLLSFSFDVFLAQSWRIEWLFIAAVALALATVLGVGAKLLIIDKFFKARNAGLVTVVLVAAIGSIRNISVGALSLVFGLVDSVDWIFRAFAGANVTLVLLISFVYVLGARMDHRATMSKLELARANLYSHRAQAEKLLENEKSMLLQQTQSALLPRLDQIQKYLTSNPEPIKAVHQLRETVESEVRPLSETLLKAAKNLTVKPEFAPQQRAGGMLLRESFQLKSLINPFSMIFLSMPGTWFFSYRILGLEAANFSLVFSLFSLAALTLIRQLLPASSKTKPGSGIRLLFLIGFIAANPLYWTLTAFSQNLEQDLALILVTLNLMGCVVGLAYNRSFQLDGLEIANQMRRDNESLEREVVLFEQQMWVARRNWSFVVHGTVQAALTAAIIRLSGSESPEEFQIQLALQDLARATNALSKTPEVEINLSQAFQDLITTWSGICTIKLNVTDRATRALARDSNARMCLNEICKEAVSNAVRHGEAKQVTIKVDRSDDELLIIEILNNGRPIDPMFRPGVGSAMLEEITLSWSISNQPATANVLLKASLPVSGMPAPSFSTSR
jgi:hypothetical protein